MWPIYRGIEQIGKLRRYKSEPYYAYEINCNFKISKQYLLMNQLQVFAMKDGETMNQIHVTMT